MVKALLLVATLQSAIGYSDMATCEAAATKLNNIQGEKIAVCIPAGKTKEDMMFERFLNMVEKIHQFQEKTVDN